MRLITRRELFLGLAAVPLLGALLAREKKVGYMDVERWFAEQRNQNGYSVLLDGQDITDGCVWFDDRTGQAEVLKRNSSGQFYAEYSKVTYNEQEKVINAAIEKYRLLGQEPPKSLVALASPTGPRPASQLLTGRIQVIQQCA